MPYTTTLTDAGKELLRSVLLDEGRIIFTSLEVGSGTPPADASDRTSLVNPVASAPITSMERGSGYFARIVATLRNDTVLAKFNVTELGLYAKASDNAVPILYVYVGITDGDGGTVPPGANILIERDYTINVFIGDAEAAATISASDPATLGDLNDHNLSDTAHENRFSTKQDKTNLLTEFTTIANADFMPVYDTSAKAHRKISLTNLIEFIKGKIVITTGDLPVIPVNKGGTGRTTLTQNAVILGNGTGNVTMRATASGAFYATGNNASPQFGVLPAAQGGTGNNTGYVRVGLKSGATAGDKATAEGKNTTPSGDNSHAEGNGTVAIGNDSHAEGLGTYAKGKWQHVFGSYNVIDEVGDKDVKGAYVEIVGNGSGASARKNARTLSWAGDESIAGHFTPMTNNTKDIGSSSFKWKNIWATTLNGILAKKVTFNNSGSGAASGTAFNANADVTVSYNTVGAAAASHTHNASNVTGGTFGGLVQASAAPALGTSCIRNIKCGTEDLTPGVSALAAGTIYLVYENS